MCELARGSAVATVHLSSHDAPRMLLGGVAVPIPFSLLAAGIECNATEHIGQDCLLVEAVLDHPDCPREVQLAVSSGTIRGTKICGHGVPDSVDVSTNQDCGVLKQTLRNGTGTTPLPGAIVTAHYTGWLENGNKFDSSRDRGVPFEFTLGQGQVIKCWDQAFATMTISEHAVISCTAPYAYGSQGVYGTIPGGATLTFDVELLGWEGGHHIPEGGGGGPPESIGVEGEEEWEGAFCGKVLGSVQVEVATLIEEEGEIMAMVDELGVYNLQLRVRHVGNITTLASLQVRGVRVIPAFLCMTPAIVIVFMAVYTKNVVLALMSGLTVGGTLISGYNPFLGFMRAGDTFLYEAVQNADQGLLLFTWFMSGLVGLISRNGGAAGLGKFFARYATTSVRAQLLTAAAGILVFFDDYSSILIVGPTMRPMADACGMSRPKLAFLVDTMAAPVASISLVSTWIGFKLSVVQQQLAAMGVKEDGLSVLVRATTYSFYPIFAIYFAVLVAATGRDFGPMKEAELLARLRHRKRLLARSATHVRAGVRACTDDENGTDSISGTHTHTSASLSSSNPTPKSTDPLAPDHWHSLPPALAHPHTSSASSLAGHNCQERGGGGVIENRRESERGEEGERQRESDRVSLGAGRDEEEAESMTEAAGVGAGVDVHMQHDEKKAMRAINAVLPVATMLVGMVGGILASGASRYYEDHADGINAPAPSMVHILSHAETTKVLIWASLTANLVAMLLALFQRLLTVEECMEAWIAGMRAVTVGLMTLLFAWGVGHMSQVLHVGPYMAGAVGSSLPAYLLPTIVTLLAALVSVASGSSWGAMVLLFPTVLPLALIGDTGEGRQHASQVLVGTIGAVISGSMFGDHVSPISDTTVLTSICTNCPIVDLIQCQAAYCGLVLGVSILASLLTAFVPESMGVVAYPAGFLTLYLALVFLSKSPAHARQEDSVQDFDHHEAGGPNASGQREGVARRRAEGRGNGHMRGWGGGWWAKDLAGERDGLVLFADGLF